ncbi:interleukin-12 receptor subunit beta-2 isoform X2 [Phycodurus eques]|uniref:interleukin-12 receptor subunit beta-2 isoform X2 n=1 Tax=Phycodurus eques TaxID=693459 RepID=UPI002ACEF292|nr:interleukin-12 receptor subunit beta-2 isoform X2 [Phycodurus eques]
MAAIPPKWSLVYVVALMLLVQLCTGKTPACVSWSSAGPVVRLGSSLEVYCTFNCECEHSMYTEHPPALQRHTVVNSSTTYVRVDNITKHRTFSCLCLCRALTPDPCGLDIWAGYPPERPRNIRCSYKVVTNQTGEVFCSWERGLKTHLKDTAELWCVSCHLVCAITRVSGDLPQPWPPFKIPIRGADPQSARFSVSTKVHFISVRVRTHNALGSAMSPPANYTLTIPSAPVLERPQCTSRGCAIRVRQPLRTQHLAVQYATEPGLWTTYPHSDVPVALDQLLSVWSLEPYRLYHFRARAKFSTGLWSDWSDVTHSWTQEEAPARQLDVWYTQPPSDVKSIRLYWKPMNVTHARGKIVVYLVAVHSSESGLVYAANLSAEATSASVAFCARCHVTVSALNSKGMSPPANITAYHTKALAQLDVQVKADEHGVALWWRQAERATAPTAHVVEWYPDGLKLQELHWLRLNGEARQAVIKGLNASECYEVAVYVLHSEGLMTTRSFRLLNISQSVPKVGPSVQHEVDFNRVAVTWRELPRAQRGGCITEYTIYLEDATGSVQQYSVQAAKRKFFLEDLPPGAHSLWVTAWTAQGESPVAQKVKILIRAADGIPVLPLVLCLLLSAAALLLLCVCQIAAVKRRVWLLFQRFMLQVVPDPANSKWAKECTQGKGEIKLQPQASEVVPTEEVEPIISIITDMEEVSNHNTVEAVSSPAGPSTPRWPLTTYIKGDSNGSEQTQASLDSSATNVDYLSTGCQERRLAMEEEDLDEEGEEEEFAQILTPLPNCSMFTEPVGPQIIGNLTLDAVRIDCSGIFENS